MFELCLKCDTAADVDRIIQLEGMPDEDTLKAGEVAGKALSPKEYFQRKVWCLSVALFCACVESEILRLRTNTDPSARTYLQ